METEDDILVDHVPRLPSPARNSETQLPRYRRRREPERYRLSAARLAMAQREPPTELVRFWFHTRHVSAHASQISDLHPHMLGLRICPSTIASFFKSVTRLLPAFVQSWVQVVFPEWLLPDCAGAIIPKSYGLLRYNGTRAMLLEYLGRISLSAPEGATMTLEELSSLLQPCYRALHAFDVHQDDANFVLDLKSAVFHYSADQRAAFLASSVRHLAKHYLSMQAYYRHQGCLEAA
ncbi:hypothetical protein BT67DRAFT_462663 [Trichocladium antarcticum]|uniref:Uncharacterized protein n=1 Tax=Trichocladium antarcticum TaxID=1450529 RepID=A0AAN6UJL4_9PEZI|nr:hypothetical protein BT67DRAFT_462663 [Trichocladium antarcticum]